MKFHHFVVILVCSVTLLSLLVGCAPQGGDLSGIDGLERTTATLEATTPASTELTSSPSTPTSTGTATPKATISNTAEPSGTPTLTATLTPALTESFTPTFSLTPAPTTTHTPTITTTFTPTPTSAPELKVWMGIEGAGCESVLLRVSVKNLSDITAAGKVVAAIRVPTGSPFVEGPLPVTLTFNNIEPGSTWVQTVRVRLLPEWLSAAAGSQVDFSAELTSGSPAQTVHAKLTRPGNCHPADTSLGLKFSGSMSGWGGVAYTLSVANAGTSGSAHDLQIEFRLVSGNNYITSELPLTWFVGDLPAGYTRSMQFRLPTSTSWFTATSGQEIILEARVVNESSNPSKTLGISSSAKVTHPGSGKPGEPRPAIPAELLASVNTPTPAAAGCNPGLIFHSYRDGNLEIYRLQGIEGDPGSLLTNLSRNDTADSQPALSPDGQWVAFVSSRDEKLTITLTDLQGSSQTRLTSLLSNSSHPIFSPDNRTILFQNNRAGNWDLFLVDPMTGLERQLTIDPSDEINPSWSPGLRWLVYQSNRDGHWSLYLLDTHTGSNYALPAADGDAILPVWSPDGKRIAFLANSTGVWDIYVVDADGRNLTRLTDGSSEVGSFDWAPDSKRLAYQMERMNNVDIYVYEFSPGREYRLTDDPGADTAPAWECTGQSVAFTSTRSGNADLWQVFWQGGKAIQITNHPDTDKWPLWRPGFESGSLGY
jgi:Tol biopolymer transport system component